MRLTLIFSILLVNILSIFCQIIPWPAKENYMVQTIDHFNFLSTQRGFTNRYKQRYLYDDRYYKPGGSIFFYCGNEGPIEGFWNNTGFMFEIAPKFNALIIFGEHRYYGMSLPFGSPFSFQQPYIQFLSIEQALADYVYMITELKTVFHAESSPVIVFGGSYGGCLAAFMRFKYPNIVSGALSSSSPIGWTSGSSGFHQFFEVITKDFRDENTQCVDIVRAGFKQMADLAAQGPVGCRQVGEYLKTCQDFTSYSNVTYAMKWLRNAFVMLAMMDYPYATNFMGNLPAHPVRVACQNLLANRDMPIVALREAAAVFYGNQDCYDPYQLYIECSDITGCGLGPESKAWDFQACTEIKLYDDSNTTSADMFPSLPLTLEQVTEYCNKTWGVKRASDQLKLLEWGNDVRTATNVIFTNGDLDPWSLGGIMSNDTLLPSSIALLVKGGAHHLDLRSSNPDDPASVRDVRKVIENWIRKWIN